MRLLTVSDLHQRRHLYSQLTAAAAEHKPDCVALVGDFLEGSREPVEGLLSIPEAAAALAALPCEVVMVRGNHEDWNWPEFEAEWLASGRALHALHGSAVTVAGLTMVGFPCLTGDDFNYSQGRELPSDSCDSWLPQLLRKTGAAGRTLWLMHEPPSTEISHPWACCSDWWWAIQTYQPRVTVSGHDHTYPFRQDKWFVTLGQTVAVNVGQRVYPAPGRLLFCTMDFNDEGRLLPKGIVRHGA